MGYYVDKRRHFESEIKKYSDPPSDALLPELPPHARCAVEAISSHAACQPVMLSDCTLMCCRRCCRCHKLGRLEPRVAGTCGSKRTTVSLRRARAGVTPGQHAGACTT